ncbi:MBL fold metallo-hydrolase [Candidatus Magnetaquicoccus inordinatus]|uniref:MBL fold metallo-hydrolase n=1 Tax=Candidatus Magnetaquicoccus inordinatus TaxID=2496818 RepID=UPI00187D2277|nr:MBL fold metallo-hydrolase [Candidatus Magnetaquicoccus inordinatus]
MSLIHDIFETGALQVNCQLLGSEESGEALLIDPGGDAERLLLHLQRYRLRLTHIINTHGHFDHIGAVAELQHKTGCQFWIHEADRLLVEAAPAHAASWGLPFGKIPRMDRTLHDKEILQVAGIELEVIHTPGHTQGGVCLKWGHEMATGDTLFAGSIGRTDLPGGNTSRLLQSIRSRLLTMDNKIICHPGHGPSTTIGQEKHNNPYL